MKRFLIVLLALLPLAVEAQPVPSQNVTAVLWMQRSGEYRALCYQAFNLAEMRIREFLKSAEKGKKYAVIFDIDETLLDNTPSEARNILDGAGFSPERWTAWVEEASAVPVPGSLEFCHFLAQNDIQPYYVTNRTGRESTATLLNLQKWNFPYADRNHLYCKSETSGKEFRRSMIARQAEILMLVGDNLSDFAQVFEDRSENFGYRAVDSLRQEFGKRFVILPNPVYGDWTRPLTGDRQGWMNSGK